MPITREEILAAIRGIRNRSARVSAYTQVELVNRMNAGNPYAGIAALRRLDRKRFRELVDGDRLIEILRKGLLR